VAGRAAAASAVVPPGSSAMAAAASRGADSGADAVGAGGGRGVAVSAVEGGGRAPRPGGPPLPRSAVPSGACIARRGAVRVSRAEAATPGPNQGLHLAGGEPQGSRPHLAGETSTDAVEDAPVSGEYRVHRVAVAGLVLLVAPAVIGGGRAAGQPTQKVDLRQVEAERGPAQGGREPRRRRSVPAGPGALADREGRTEAVLGQRGARVRGFADALAPVAAASRAAHGRGRPASPGAGAGTAAGAGNGCWGRRCM
jgi:hypothetical protein